MNRPLLRLGSQGLPVTLLQQALNTLESTLAKLAVDGIFGPKTHGRVLEHQRKNHLMVDGVVGEQTHLSLEEIYDLIEQLILPTPPEEQAARDTIVKLARMAAAVMGWPESAPPPPDPTSQRIACRVGLGTPINERKDQLRQGGFALAHIYGTAGHQFAASCLTIQDEHIKFFQANPNAPAREKNQRIPDWCGIFCLYVYRTSGLKMSSWPLKLLKAPNVEPEFDSVRRWKDVKPGDIGLISPFDGGRNHHFLVGDVKGTSIRSIDGNAGTFSSIIERNYSITNSSPDDRGAFRISTKQGTEPVLFASPRWNKVLTSSS